MDLVQRRSVLSFSWLCFPGSSISGGILALRFAGRWWARISIAAYMIAHLCVRLCRELVFAHQPGNACLNVFGAGWSHWFWAR